MSNFKIPGLINPYWKADPLFSKMATAMLFLEGSEYTSADMLRINGALPLNGNAWTVGPNGRAVTIAADTWVDTAPAGDTFDYIAPGLTFMHWANTVSAEATAEYLTLNYMDGDNFIKFGRLDNKIYCVLKIDENWAELDGAALNNNDGLDHQWVFVSDAQGIATYFDGVLIASDVSIGKSGVFDSSTINIGGDGSEGFIGNITSSCSWKRGLSGAEIFELYKRGPKLGLASQMEIDPSFFGAIMGAGSAWNPAFASNNNFVL
jgi:hypothetical protein